MEPKDVVINGAPILSRDKTVRLGKDLNGYFQAEPEADAVIYEVYTVSTPEKSDLCHAVTVIKPGKVGKEFHMTKGHFHEEIDTDEVYFGLKGNGIILMQNKEGDVKSEEISEGVLVHVPGGWAHRSINTGSDDFVILAVYQKRSGHDYREIEEKGFRSLVVEDEGQVRIIDNPNK